MLCPREANFILVFGSWIHRLSALIPCEMPLKALMRKMLIFPELFPFHVSESFKSLLLFLRQRELLTDAGYPKRLIK